ncbi:MAG: hypothetical protein QOH63_2118 [Acidobacteriota bacterium]|jgi:hypothetical protein|nr:hypothetical protein [Acidobacteriota bacterium]
MSKTIVSAFDNQQKAARLLDSAIASGLDSRFFHVIDPAESRATPLNSLVPNVPRIQARLYQKHLQMGDSLLIAQVKEDDVPQMIRLLQSKGGHHIEAFDQVSSSCA